LDEPHTSRTREELGREERLADVLSEEPLALATMLIVSEAQELAHHISPVIVPQSH
jgi:hypothetical protein